MSDISFLKETLKLAKKGIGWTNPNPMVGAVIVKNGKIIGRGYHKKFGQNHGEIEALSSTTEDPKGATLYINLEPCGHFGKTPPCVDAIIKSGTEKVVCSILDPNPKVKGLGIAKLKNAGIKIDIGMLENEARELNEAFFSFYEKKRPFVVLKFATSLDGKIATKTGDSKWVTNEKSRLFDRNLRGEYQAILVGINTVIKDNPHLGARIKGKKDPVRIILDSTLRIPFESQVLRDNNVIVVTTNRADKNKKEELISKNIKIISLRTNGINISDLLEELTKRSIISVFVEGGSHILGSFVDAKLVDKVYAFYAPILIGGEKAISAIGGQGVEKISEALQLNNISLKKFEDNFLISGYIKK